MSRSSGNSIGIAVNGGLLRQNYRNPIQEVVRRETDKEWIARGGQLIEKDLDFLTQRDKEHGWNDGSNRQLSGEHRLFLTLIQLAIEAALGGDVPAAHPKASTEDSCLECHLHTECSCPTTRFKWADVLGGYPSSNNYYIVIKDDKPRRPSKKYMLRGKRIPAFQVFEVDGWLVHKVFKRNCKQHAQHTEQACALRWINTSADFQQWCENCNLDVENVRRQVKERLNGVTHADSRLSGQARCAVGSPEVGR
jgi:hypothetical protein